MGLWIDGEFTEEEKEFIENKRGAKELWTSVSNIQPNEPGYDKFGDNVGVYFEKGDIAFDNTIKILKIFDQPKADRVYEIDKTNYENNEKIFGEYSTGYLFSLEEIEEIYDAIKDTHKMYLQLSDGFEIYTDKKTMIEAVDPGLIKYNDRGTLVWDDCWLGAEIEQVIKFFQLAIKLQRLIKVTT